jgi:hypothetical protein
MTHIQDNFLKDLQTEGSTNNNPLFMSQDKLMSATYAAAPTSNLKIKIQNGGNRDHTPVNIF